MNLPSTPSLKLLPPTPRSPSSLFSFSASPDSPLSQYCSHSISPCLHFLLQTASWGTRVYFATCGDGSLPRPELAASGCWFLTCVHSFTSTAAHSSLLPLEDPQGSFAARTRATLNRSRALAASGGALWNCEDISLQCVLGLGLQISHAHLIKLINTGRDFLVSRVFRVLMKCFQIRDR